MASKRFTVEPGRHIHRDGKPFIAVTRVGIDTSPTECDDITHAIAALLNQTSGRLLRQLSKRPPGFYRELAKRYAGVK